MQHIDFCGLKVSRMIVGSNPFSGFSHQGSDTDLAMRRYYTTEQIKATLREAESLGINTVIGRTDHHIVRVLMEYWDQGGTIQWVAQTCPDVGNHISCVARAIEGGAKACFIHGGVMDHLFVQKQTDEILPIIDLIRSKGVRAGIAGHNPKVFEWAEENLDVDFYLCCYYNSINRDTKAEHVSGTAEWFLQEDRQTMTDLIRRLSKPVIHYKILAAGRNDPSEAFAYCAKSMRPNDAVCVGVYTAHHPDMLKENAQLLTTALETQSRN